MQCSKITYIFKINTIFFAKIAAIYVPIFIFGIFKAFQNNIRYFIFSQYFSVIYNNFRFVINLLNFYITQSHFKSPK